MSLDRFLADPWNASHPAYEESPLHIRPAPEFATAEVMVASLYRACGFKQTSERDVPGNGKELEKASQQKRTHERIESPIRLETWRSVLHGVLESPKQPNQSSKRFLQLCPVVPDVALYSGSPRLSGNSWNPGALVQRLVLLGSQSHVSAAALWKEVFTALSVTDEDDVWARWLQEEFVRRRKPGTSWTATEFPKAPDFPESEKTQVRFPAQQFVNDLGAILAAKSQMTRRQWVSLLEAVLRTGAAAHVLWLCDVNKRLWDTIREVITGRPVPDELEIRRGVLSADRESLKYGSPALPIVRDCASSYLSARVGINLVLWRLDAAGYRTGGALSGTTEIAKLLSLVKTHREKLLNPDLLSQFENIHEDQARALSCKKGIGSNLVEFFRHVLGQRQTANENLRGYDQGYVLRKRGAHLSAPWVISLGPVAVLAIVHCCLRGAAGPRSVQRLCQHLGCYGIQVDRDDIAKGDLGRNLRMLGLVLDSPDAESGMLLVPPFDGVPASAEESNT